MTKLPEAFYFASHTNKQQRLEKDHVKAAAQGQWRKILIEFGVDLSCLDGKHHPCPLCGGKDRFRFDDKNGDGSYFCNQCKAGDGFTLVGKKLGLDPNADFSRILERVAEVVGMGADITPHPGNRVTAGVQSTQKHDPQAIWDACEQATNDHPYLARKGVQAHGLRLYRGTLIISKSQVDGALVMPLCSQDGKIQTLQFITDSGAKLLLPGRPKKGAFHTLGGLSEIICIAEGYATGASIHKATGYQTIVAVDCGNLLPVAKAVRVQHPRHTIALCADDDHQTSGNPGLSKAKSAAQAVGGHLVTPRFGDDRPEGATDFNDLYKHFGSDAVKECIKDTKWVARNDENELNQIEWPGPQPLTSKIEPEPYPLDALPNTIRAAVEEVLGFVKAPIPMVASSALAALSLACQAHIDAKRAEKLHGPVGLFLLTIADSGERKSTCDSFFTKPIRDYEEAQAEAAQPVLKDHNADIGAWEAKKTGIKEKIRQLAKEQKATMDMESALRELEHNKPEPPRIPRLLYADATPEALAYGLAKQWPSGGVVSAEAGIVFGSHSMGKDSIMRNLGLLNQLWDGTSLTIDRRSTESFIVRGARLTVALQVQEPTLREFLIRSGPLARGTGFLARFLVAWPESTQGQRPFTDPPANWPHLAAFHHRITEILNQPAPINEDGALTPAMLSLAPDAKKEWISYHDAIERELAGGGELYDVRDVASKSADNAARLAALFQMFKGAGGAIGADAFEGASRITAWHLSEARRFFGELALPVELADAVQLDSWLIKHCRQKPMHFVTTRDAQRLGPIRDKEKLAAALRELEELDRVKVVQERRQKTIKMNPALVGTP
ncbi:MAG: DUF3987 domain-containing protein [Magnetococcales bacterium]|nr:DUF3987 domain-containing protein [Magnetococcales bacterium]